MTATPQHAATFQHEGVEYPAARVVEGLAPLVSEQRMRRLREVLSRRLTSVRLAVEDLHHEHNGAACIRTAEALGVQTIMAAEIRNPYPVPGEGSSAPGGERQWSGKVKGALRASAIPRTISTSAHRWIDLERYSSGVELVRAAQAQGFLVFGAGPRATHTLREIPQGVPVVLLFGNEADGLLEETMAACDGIFRVPMYGFTESFNLSVTAGIVLEQVCARLRDRLEAEGRLGELSEEQIEARLAEWVARDFKPKDLGPLLRRLVAPLTQVGAQRDSGAGGRG